MMAHKQSGDPPELLVRTSESRDSPASSPPLPGQWSWLLPVIHTESENQQTIDKGCHMRVHQQRNPDVAADYRQTKQRPDPSRA